MHKLSASQKEGEIKKWTLGHSSSKVNTVYDLSAAFQPQEVEIASALKSSE